MSEWREISNGNYIYELDTGEHMTVFEKNGRWFGVFDYRFTEDSFKAPQQAMTIMEQAVLRGNLHHLSFKTQRDTDWRSTKSGGFHRRRQGVTFTVKQARSENWYLVIGQTLLKDHWFASAEEAMRRGDLL
jgi:hypothetical protein